VSNLPIAPTFPYLISPTNVATTVDLNPGASGIGVVCMTALDSTDLGYVCFLKFSATGDAVAAYGDFELVGNGMCRFSIGPASRYVSIVLDRARTSPFFISYYIEGRNE
jgi:hypothetical protein